MEGEFIASSSEQGSFMFILTPKDARLLARTTYNAHIWQSLTKKRVCLDPSLFASAAGSFQRYVFYFEHRHGIVWNGIMQSCHGILIALKFGSQCQSDANDIQLGVIILVSRRFEKRVKGFVVRHPLDPGFLSANTTPGPVLCFLFVLFSNEHFFIPQQKLKMCFSPSSERVCNNFFLNSSDRMLFVGIEQMTKVFNFILQ